MVSCRLSSGRWLCGLVCWSLALLVSLWGVPGPDAPPGSEYAYSVVVRQLLEQQQVRVCSKQRGRWEVTSRKVKEIGLLC